MYYIQSPGYIREYCFSNKGAVMETRTFKPSPDFLRYLSTSWIIWTVSGTVLSSPILLIPDPVGRYVLGSIWAAFIVYMICVRLWIGPYYRSFAYRIDEDAVRMQYGVFWKQDITVPYNKITNVDVTQGPLQRAFGIGIVHVQTAGAGGAQGSRAEIRLSGIAELREIKRILVTYLQKYEVNRNEIIPAGAKEDNTLIMILEELREIKNILGKK